MKFALVFLFLFSALFGFGQTYVPAPDPASLLQGGAKTSFVTLETETGLTLPMVVFTPDQPRSPVGVVVFLHQLGGTYVNWATKSQEAARKGLLAVDLQIAATLGDKKCFGWGQSAYALEVVLTWLRGSELVDKGRISLAGSSIGANASLAYFGSDPSLHSVFALSPGLNYYGVRPGTALGRTAGRIAVIVCSEPDTDALQAVVQWKPKYPGPEYLVYPSGGHGIELFQSQPSVVQRFTQFLDELALPL